MKKSFIDTQNAKPIFQQIVDEIERRILIGELRPGDFLTSVRDFAVQVEVNPNTVAKAYQLLQAQGLVEPVRGTGLRVRALAARRGEQRRDELLQEKIVECVDLARSLGIPIQQVIEMIKERGKK